MFKSESCAPWCVLCTIYRYELETENAGKMQAGWMTEIQYCGILAPGSQSAVTLKSYQNIRLDS